MEKIKQQLLRGDIKELAHKCGCTQVTVRAAMKEPKTAKHYEVIAAAKALIEYRKKLVQ